jgi:RecA-family ATPase
MATHLLRCVYASFRCTVRDETDSVSANVNLEAALRLIREGFIVFPCRADKTPHVRFLESSTRNEAVVLSWWARWPDALPALPCGDNGLCVVDCDRKDEGIDGVANFHAGCAASRIDVSVTFAVDTPSGGRHYYFRAEGECAIGNTVSKLGKGIDTRGAGGYVIAPGAAMPDGRAYLPVQSSLSGIAPLPLAIADFLSVPHIQETSTVDPTQATDADRAYALAALRDECDKLCAVKCNRNNALNKAAHTLGTLVGNGTLNEADVVSLLHEAATMNGYTQKPEGSKRAFATIYSGLKSGMSKPRPLPSQAVPPLSPALQASLAAKGRMNTLPAPVPTKRTVKLLRGSEIQTRNIEWLWKGFLPLGMLTLLGGDAGTGKSTVAFSLAATVTVGGTWPDGTRLASPGNVLIWSGEDSPQLTIAPRMIAAGCSPDRYGVIEGVTNEHGESLSFDPAQDVPLLRQTAQSIGGISLLIIDPLISAVAGDAHRANEVRRYLQPIVDLADELNCAVIGIHHHAKNSAGRDAVSRMLGSQAFTALARMVMQTVRVKDTDTRIVAISKSNITLDRGGFSYTIEPVALSNGVSTTVVRWGVAVEGTAQNIIDDAEGVERESRPLNRISEAEQFLHEELKNGPRPVRELIELAKNQVNLSERTLQRAKERLGIVATKAGFGDGWVWQFPFNSNSFLTARQATVQPQ